MEKVIIEKPGGYERLQIKSVPQPKPKGKEVLIEIKASGVNYADVIVRWGLYESAKKFVGWPITPGFEYAGQVIEVGPDVKKFKRGDSIVGVSLFGAYASHICVTEDYVFPLPKNWTYEQAAGMPAVYLTAYHALFQNVVIRPGAKILVHSAAGGVGTALLQMCKLKGFHAVGVVGASHKVETAKAFGAEHVIDKSTSDLWAEAERIYPEGYDIILDANGVSTLGQSFKHLAPCGKLMVYGFHSMLPKQGGRVNLIKLAVDYLRTPSFSPINMTTQNTSIITFNISFLWERLDLIQEAMTDILKWIENGQLAPPKVSTYDLSNVAQAHKDIESGQTVGKLVLKPHH